ncbi:MAG: hypothetical protein ACRD1Z_09050 [Vicinamibacteria bacterium]
MKPEDETFVTAFRAYVQWVAGKPNPPERPRAEMLRAFREFLIAGGITPDEEAHFDLLAKMTEFAKGKDKPDPRG